MLEPLPTVNFVRYFLAFILGGVVAVGGLFVAQQKGLIPEHINLPMPQIGQQNPWMTGIGGGSAAAGRIRVASFNIQVFGETKAEDPLVMKRIAETIRQYDVVAVQEIRTQRHDLLPRLMDLINADGRQYAYALSPRLGRTQSKEQYAFIYDKQSVALENAYTIEDPDDLLHREPMVGWFRALGVPPEEAFTFTLVNVHVDPDEVDFELGFMDDVFRRVQDDSRMEDDILLVGDFNAGPDRILAESDLSSCVAAIIGQTTNVAYTQAYDNVVFHRPATVEFTGISGVDDFLKRLNITSEEAKKISDHFPVWAEFSRYEGGKDISGVLIGRGGTGPVDGELRQ